ncbi:MAG TPA: sulfatase-like hydrolase/transferase, partial [Kofleriaceae bacterium]
MFSSLRSGLRWLAPSALAAGCGGVIAGLVEARTATGLGVIGLLATAGFLALIAVPALLIGGAAIRGLIAAWQPGAVAAGLTDEDGAAPRLAGWVAVIVLGAVALAAAMFQSVWLLAVHTAFKPLPVSYLEPMFAVGVVLGLLAVSRPAARGFAWLARKLDARWQRRGHRTLLRPRLIFGVPVMIGGFALLAIWLWIIKPRIGPLDLSPLIAPVIAVALAIVTHLGHGLLGRARRPLGVVVSIVGLAAMAAAIVAPFVRPSVTLEIWGDQPLAGLAIEGLFDLDALRDRISTTELRPELKPGAAHPDIVLITIDTVRADHTPPYNGTADMPALRELGQRGSVFEWAFAPSNVTRRSVPSMVIGLSPNHVRGRVVGWALRVDPRHVLLAERMRAGGYATAGFMCCDGFWSKKVHTGLERGLDHLEIDPVGPQLARAAHAWLAAREQQAGAPPLFVWMHILEPHNWTQLGPTPADDAGRRRQYDRALAGADQMLQQVMSAFA